MGNAFLILFLKLKIISAESECVLYNTCTECSLCKSYSSSECKCEWSSSSCQSSFNLDKKHTSWYEMLSSCQEEEIDSIYCPEKNYFTKDDFIADKIEIRLNKDANNKYGKEFTLCTFEYVDDKEIYNYDLNFSFDSSLANKPSVYYYYSLKERNNIIDEGRKEVSDNYETSISQLSNLQIILLLKDEYTANPITITIEKTGNIKTKLIISFIIGIIFTFAVVAIVCFTRNYYNNKTRDQLRMLRAQMDLDHIQPVIISPGIDENELKNQNTQKLNELFAGRMAEHSYKKDYNQYGGGCSICLENFSKKSKVSITSCNHVFHYKCIYEWLFKNILCPKCPNCNNEVLKDANTFIKEKIDNQNHKEKSSTLQIKRRKSYINIRSSNFDLSSQNEMMNNNTLGMVTRNTEYPSSTKKIKRRKSKTSLKI